MAKKIINQSMSNKQIPAISLLVATIFMIASVAFVFSRLSTEQERLNESWSNYAAVTFASGSGTEKAPYIISGPEELALLSKIVNSGADTTGVYYKLSKNISLKGHDWEPIGHGNPFKGNFDGNKHTISNMTILSKKNVNNYGLFGVNCGNISDLKLTKAVANISFSNARRNWNLNDKICIGALAGINQGNISNCDVVSSIQVNSGDSIYLASLCGINDGGKIELCQAEGSVDVNGGNVVAVGGMLGATRGKGDISFCCFEGTVEINEVDNPKYVVGGFMGDASASVSKVSNCVAVMTITDENVNNECDIIGGFLGRMSEQDDITSCLCKSIRKYQNGKNYIPFGTENRLFSSSCGYFASKSSVILWGDTAENSFADRKERENFIKQVIGLSSEEGKWLYAPKKLTPSLVNNITTANSNGKK